MRDICDAQKYDKLVIRSKDATDQAISSTTFGEAYHARVSTIACHMQEPELVWHIHIARPNLCYVCTSICQTLQFFISY